MSYTSFEIYNLKLSSGKMTTNGSLTVSARVKNTGNRRGDEVVQLYLHDPVATIAQPVRRLRGFKRVALEPGHTRNVSFNIDRHDVGFFDNNGRFVVEPGRMRVYAGNSSVGGLGKTFHVVSRSGE